MNNNQLELLIKEVWLQNRQYSIDNTKIVIDLLDKSNQIIMILSDRIEALEKLNE